MTYLENVDNTTQAAVVLSFVAALSFYGATQRYRQQCRRARTALRLHVAEVYTASEADMIVSDGESMIVWALGGAAWLLESLYDEVSDDFVDTEAPNWQPPAIYYGTAQCGSRRVWSRLRAVLTGDYSAVSWYRKRERRLLRRA